ncbi:hypothetical protein [Mycobacterium asiaticum]|uniref:Uncharacterized protein n=1 Tax=Mycobacterium asiaticum TaxID=1790 RepID=A0A1A3N151_MYCAS|nr:hypothetical protein [Mycobacterium asiaticum]OBK15868.1 hypothetical protein A5636_00350 [Mycobacterium asiaticum]
MADDELDSLYWAPPQEFTAERTRLAKAAKGRADAAAAKQISAARRPTTAAWVVNRLAIGHPDAVSRMAELGDSLRDAHSAMDGVQIRELSTRQHRLINGLTRVAFDAAELKNPSAGVRDDVAGTLQAAIADPEVRARLGRLAKAEQWSGFGDFGDAAAVSTATRSSEPKSPPKAKPDKPDKRDKDAGAARRQREKLTAALAAAERAEAKADRVLSEQQDRRDAARQRRDEALQNLRAAERELSAEEGRYQAAQERSQAAAEATEQARARLKQG